MPKQQEGDGCVLSWKLRSLFIHLVVALLGLAAANSAGTAEPKSPLARPVAAPASSRALLATADWQRTPLAPISSQEVDHLLSQELEQLSTPRPSLAPLTTDEQFLRRVTLDLAGRLPRPEEVEVFLADRDPRKRGKRIDQFLESDEYARHWARFWNEVIAARSNMYMKRLAPIQEMWLYEQLQGNKGWGEIVRAMLTADAVLTDGYMRPPSELKQPINGAAYFIATRFYEKTRVEGAVDAAAETARIFLGLQLQCAQCHNHPFDQWERVQFHQLAAYFGRSGGRPKSGRPGDEGALRTWALVFYPQGEYEMPDQKDPQQLFTVHPTFLDGKGPGEGLLDVNRRRALADAVVDKNNYWFAAAYINRVWSELLGQGFYQPVDDLGPQKEGVFLPVLSRLTGAFRASDYDIKGLFRTILNTQAYQRQFRMGTSPTDHLYFTAARPTPLRADVLWRDLNTVLAPANPIPAAPPVKYAIPQGPEAEFLAEFGFDPSLTPEKSLTQILLLMNGNLVNNRIQVSGSRVLSKVLKDYPEDREALRFVYLSALARKPTDRELDKCRQFIEQVGKRGEAYEDILWALVNSPEFQTKR